MVMGFLRNKKEVDKMLALQQLQNAAKLLGGELTHSVVVDRNSSYEKYVIEFGKPSRNYEGPLYAPHPDLQKDS